MTQMWLLLPVVLLSGVVCAQGADTIELSDMFLKLAQNELEFSFAFNGNSNHQLHNVSLELISEGIDVIDGRIHCMTSSPDNGEVIDIIGINYSEKADISYQLHTISGFQELRVRANGTIYSGVTALSNTTVLSRLPEFVDIDQGAPDPCGNVSVVVVRSIADPTYTPWRIISPAGFDVFAQANLSAPNTAIGYALYKVDQLADSLTDMSVTIEMINNATGASVGAGTLSPQNLFPTTNLTIDEGAWKLRANFTSTSPRNAGTFTAYSEEFYVKGPNPPDCLVFAKVTPVAHTNAGSRIRPPLCHQVWLGWFVWGYSPRRSCLALNRILLYQHRKD
ncbi:hypothetical protein DFH08DRAFT_863080, partial [Mycena albidolilacea]